MVLWALPRELCTQERAGIRFRTRATSCVEHQTGSPGEGQRYLVGGPLSALTPRAWRARTKVFSCCWITSWSADRSYSVNAFSQTTLQTTLKRSSERVDIDLPAGAGAERAPPDPR